MNEYFIIYTLEVGGMFSIKSRATVEEYDQAKESGWLNIGGDPEQFVRPVWLVLASVEDDFDFSLGSSRKVYSVA